MFIEKNQTTQQDAQAFMSQVYIHIYAHHMYDVYVYSIYAVYF